MSEGIPGDVTRFLADYDDLSVIETGEGTDKRTRIRCNRTNHEILPTLDALTTHINSKKYKKAKDWYSYDFSKFEPYIVQHRRKPKSLYCNVTKTVLNRIPEEVNKHINGKKYQRLLIKVKDREKKHESQMQSGSNEFDANAFENSNGDLILSDSDGDELNEDNENDEEVEDEVVDEVEDEEVDEDEEEAEEADSHDDLDDLYPEESDNDEHYVVPAPSQQKKRKTRELDEKTDLSNKKEKDNYPKDKVRRRKRQKNKK